MFVDIPEQDANYVHGCDLRLMLSAKDVSQIPTAGRDLIIVAGVGNLLHFRIFDSDGKRVVNTDEKQLAKSGSQMTKLKSLLSKLRKDPRVSPLDKDEVIKSLASMFGGTYVPNGTKASVLAQAYRDEPIAGTVTRTSWALNVKSRTLRAEIDLPNPGGQLLPGMYAYANVIIERTGVRALPVSALTSSGDRTYCWICQDGRAERTEIQTGVSEGQWIEVTNLRRPTDSSLDRPWRPIDGTEHVIIGDLSILADGAAVQVASVSEVAKAASLSIPSSSQQPSGQSGFMARSP